MQQYRWLNRTRIQLHLLEDRLQPGSLLVGGVDLSAFEGVLPNQRISSADQLDISVVSQPADSSVQMQIINSAPDTYQATANKQTNETETSTPSGSIVDLEQTSARPGRAAVVTQGATATAREIAVNNPSVHAPITGLTASKASPAAAQQEISKFATPALVTGETPESRVNATSEAAQFNPSRYQLQAIPGECNSDGPGTRVNNFNTYAGTAGADGYNAVAAGKGPLLVAGHSFSAGTEFGTIFAGTPAGRITRYDATGLCVATIYVVAGAGVPVVINDIAVSPNPGGPASNNVYVVASIAGTAAAAVARLDETLTAFVGAPYVEAAPAGGTIAFNGVGVSPVTAPALEDVFVTGTINDPAAAAFDRIRALRFPAALGAIPTYAVNVSFGVATEGRAVDADRGNNAYIVGNLLSAPASRLALRLKLTAAGVIDPVWVGGFTTGTAVPTGDVRNGWNGVDFLPGSNANSGLYMTGSAVDGGNPAGLNQHIRRVNPVTGGTIAGSGFLYGAGAGVDLGGEDIIVDRFGPVYTAGYIGTAADRDAFYIQFTNLGAAITTSDALGGVGTQDLGRGIDILNNAVTPSVIFMSGSTDTPTGGMLPPPGGCDPTSNGGVDSFAAAGSQPAPF